MVISGVPVPVSVLRWMYLFVRPLYWLKCVTCSAFGFWVLLSEELLAQLLPFTAILFVFLFFDSRVSYLWLQLKSTSWQKEVGEVAETLQTHILYMYDTYDTWAGCVLKVAQFLGAVSERDLLTLSFGMRSQWPGEMDAGKGDTYVCMSPTAHGIVSMGTRLKLTSWLAKFRLLIMQESQCSKTKKKMCANKRLIWSTFRPLWQIGQIL